VSPCLPAFLPLAPSLLIGESRFLYDKKDASFVDLPPPIDAHAVSDPPNNCAICAQREEQEIQAQGRIIRKTGSVTGVAVHGATFHVGDFALLRAEEGPARVGQITGLFSGSPVWIRVQLLGRLSDLVDLLPADELRDEVRFSSSTHDSPVHLVFFFSFLLASFVLHG
jgi:DNA (cytosine-5)-methyltransferase 1